VAAPPPSEPAPGGFPAPLSPEEFAGLMAPLGPFETAPALALAVSGGADSLALAVLADGWAAAQGGTATALIVDHRLRPDSTAEAAMVRDRLVARGIKAVVLTRDGPIPSGDLQAAARGARYALLADWCRAHSVLHLLTAHHRDDQAETLLLRLARGSGLAGLAAMPAIQPLGPCQLLRPLLPIPAARLRATTVAADLAWVEDPGNGNDAFARVRLRKAAPQLDALGLGTDRLAATARHLGRARDALDRQVSLLLAEAAAVQPAGFAWLDPVPLAAADAETALRALGAVVTCIGGHEFTPRFERLDALWRAIRDAGLRHGRTLAGCRILPQAGRLLVCREPAAVAPPITLAATPQRWDDRFLIDPSKLGDPAGTTLGALGAAEAARLRRELGATRQIPLRVWPTLPTLRRQDSIIAVPHLGWLSPDAETGTGCVADMVRFRPRRTLTDCGFTVV
jgi:tRNA(Ile)-lysidine synthase